MQIGVRVTGLPVLIAGSDNVLPFVYYQFTIHTMDENIDVLVTPTAEEVNMPEVTTETVTVTTEADPSMTTEGETIPPAE
jgi:hypothetical protein